MTPAILLASRSGGRYFACLAALTLVSVTWSGHAFKIELSMGHPAVLMGIPEMCGVLLATVAVILLRPRMWIVDRLGVPSRRWIPSALMVVAGLAGPQIVIAAAALASLPSGTWLASATTVLFLSALAFLVSPFSGALVAASKNLMLYFTLMILAQLEPMIRMWSPLATVVWSASTVDHPPYGKALVATVTTVAASIVTVRTQGRTMRTWGRDLDTA